MAAKVAAVAALLAVGVTADCPNACSGQGECGPMDQCNCYDGFFGGDCSLRVCPVGAAFVDTPRGDLNHDGGVGYAARDSYSKVQWSRYKQYEAWPSVEYKGSGVSLTSATGPVDVDPQGANTVGGWKAQPGEAHFLVECSGKGSCDRELGVCKCFDGYTGSSCQRTTCPNDCSGRGVCRTVGEIARTATGRTFVDSAAGVNTYAGIDAPYEYRLWDADKNTACVCDPGFSGIDCSLRECPRGDDPMTFDESTCAGGPCTDETQAFSVDGGQAAPGGSYFLRFTDFSGVSYKTRDFQLVTDATAATTAKAANEAAVKAALESLPNNVTGLVAVTSAYASSVGGASGREQLRVKVTFKTKSGNVPDMSVGWSGSATQRSFMFQPGQPVHTFTITGLDTSQDTILFRLFPVDQTLYGREEYWTTPATVQLGPQITDVPEKIASALNSIPAVKLSYGAPFVAHATVIVTYPQAGKATIKLAFPDKQLGANRVQYQLRTSGGQWEEADALADVTDGNKEAALCSNRGLCDYSTGLCKCFAGHTGENCALQSALARGSSL